MKKFSAVIITFLTLVGFSACSTDDDVQFIAQPDPEGINFTNTFASNYILTSATADNTAERFVWNEIDVDVPTNVQYELQGSTTQGFDDYTVLGTSSTNNLAITVKQLMSLAKDKGLDSDPATEAPNSGQLYFRVVASAGTGGELAHTSEVKALTVTFPEAQGEEPLLNLFFVGNATPDNWSNNDNNLALFRDPENPNIFYFTGKFNAGEFKLLEVLGAWQPQWGLVDGELTNSEILGEDPGAFVVDTEGYYSFEVNVEDMTYSMEPYDVGDAATYASLGIVGPAQAGGWDADTDMVQLNPHIWFVDDIEFAAGEFKFRANDAWDANWGIASDALSGKANFGSNENMTAEAGIYDIYFSDLTGRYILIPQGEE